jgi:hypothetical protein
MRGRPLKLNEAAQSALPSRVFIAQTTQTFTQTEVARGFEIGLWTLRRYTQESERAYSRRLSAAQYEESRKLPRGGCHFCKAGKRKHPRCKDCQIFIHAIKTDRNGGSPDMKRCNSCFHAKLRAYGLE